MSMHTTPGMAGLLETWKPDHCAATASKAQQPVDEIKSCRHHNALPCNRYGISTDASHTKGPPHQEV